MALDLSGNPLLEAAQDSQSRRPLIEILSQNSVPDIPFDGQYLTSESVNEKAPNSITHSSGRLCLVYTYETVDPDLRKIKYVYSDVDRTFFTTVILSPPGSHYPVEATLCELANGNIGIIYYATYSTNHQLRFLVITVEGVEVIADTELATYTSSYPIANPFVIRLADDSYLLVYTKMDGTDFKIMKRTSADFITWSAESEIAPAGLASDHGKYNPSLVQITTGDIFLWLDYVDDYGLNNEEKTNIYYSVSMNNGANWGAATKVTNYTTYDTVAKHPIAAQKIADQLHLIFNEQSGAISIDVDSLGFCGTDCSIVDLSFDPVKRMLYAISAHTQIGTKFLYCVIKIDVDSWTIDDCWDDNSVPAFNAVYWDYSGANVLWGKNHGEGNYVPVAITGDNNVLIVSVLDGEADTITEYIFLDVPAYGLVKNVNYSLRSFESIQSAWVDYESRRLYLTMFSPNNPIIIGYIDLTEVSETYAFTTVVSSAYPGAYYGLGVPSIIPDVNYVLIPYSSPFGSPEHQWLGRLKVHLLSDGSTYKDYQYSTHPQFPYHGLEYDAYLNGKIYGSFVYESDFGQEDYRGLCEINLADDMMIYHRPSWATLDEYGLGNMVVMDDGRILMTVNLANPDYNGVTIFDPLTHTWILHTNETLPGIFPPGKTQGFYVLAFDEQEGLIYAGIPDGFPATPGAVVAFSIYGFLNQAQYIIGTYSGGVWSFPLPALQLVQGILDADAVIALDPMDQAIYAFWVRQDVLEYSIKWDKEDSEFDVGQYIIRGSEIVVNRTINGDPASLEFEVSHGHLFDPHNLNSLWNIYLKKFRKINLRFGDKAFGTDIVIDGDFGSAGLPDWTLGSGWADGTGKAAKNAAGTGTLTPAVAINASIGTIYEIIYEVKDWTVGSITMTYGGISDVPRTANGTYIAHVIAITTGSLIFSVDATTARFSIDNVSVKALIEYWQQCGVFFVKQIGPINYERPIYPSIKIVAEDNLGMWEFANLVATEHYETYPKDILEDLIPEVTNLTLADLDVPDFNNSVILYHQWIETPIRDIISQICERFGYYPRIDVDGKFTAKEISDINPTDHIYYDLTKILRFSPDDSYSDYTNKIVVMGEGRDWIEVLYNEEAIQSFTGTMGWWGKHRNIMVAYSNDYSRRCRYPRMEIIESVKDGPYHCNLGSESLWFIDPNEKYFIIRIIGPDLVGALIAFVVAWLIGAIICAVLNGFNYGIGIACAIINTWIMYEIMQIMGTQGAYNYNTYAQPVGKVRQSFQANANDLILQTEMGMIVERKFEDPLCYTLAQSQFVADFEMMITQLQRNRVTFEKMADLRDEEGDIIQVLHPFSGQAMRILITDLKRRFKIPSSSESNDGYFLDEIEGWKL